jgi:uncharacterized protein with NAD-binding domain and iron-sulfur cluster
MSTKKTVKIKESELVDLIDNIVKETVQTQKKQWISEQKKKNNTLVESRLAKLEAKLKNLK